jgi:uncharacterized protein YjbJ (UPF0337 family)
VATTSGGSSQELEAGEGKVKEKWGQLTDDVLNVIAGRRNQLKGDIQERYGYARIMFAVTSATGMRRSIGSMALMAALQWELMPGKRIQFDDATWQALDLLARDRMMDFQELADEAFRDLLKKHGRPTDLKSALRQSASESAAIVRLAPNKGRKRRNTD